jgi:hypothetical protein
MVLRPGAAVMAWRRSCSGHPPAEGGSGTPRRAPRPPPGAPRYWDILRQAASVGKYPLNKPAVNQIPSQITSATSKITSKMAATQSGKPGKSVIGIYNTGSATSVASSSYKGLVFVGYDGTFNPTNLMNLAQKNLKSSRVVNAGPHGGKMMCGYNTSNNSVASECVWATTTTFGVVEYFRHGHLAKVTNASPLALKVRDAVEVRAQ